jgi:hypothetical protein
MDIRDRLKELIELLNVTPTDFAKDLNILPGVIFNTILKKRKDMMCGTLTKILKRHPTVDANWLLTGRGKPFLKGHPGYDTYVEKYADDAQVVEPNNDTTDMKKMLLELKDRIEELENMKPGQ